MIREDINEMIKRAVYFYKDKILIHVTCNDGTFYNGIIIEISEPEFFLIDDRLNKETPVFFSNVKRIERFNER